MEILILAVVAFVATVYWMWRVRAGSGSDDLGDATQGLPDDGRGEHPPASHLPGRGGNVWPGDWSR